MKYEHRGRSEPFARQSVSSQTSFKTLSDIAASYAVSNGSLIVLTLETADNRVLESEYLASKLDSRIRHGMSTAVFGTHKRTRTPSVLAVGRRDRSMIRTAVASLRHWNERRRGQAIAQTTQKECVSLLPVVAKIAAEQSTSVTVEFECCLQRSMICVLEPFCPLENTFQLP